MGCPSSPPLIYGLRNCNTTEIKPLHWFKADGREEAGLASLDLGLCRGHLQHGLGRMKTYLLLGSIWRQCGWCSSSKKQNKTKTHHHHPPTYTDMVQGGNQAPGSIHGVARRVVEHPSARRPLVVSLQQWLNKADGWMALPDTDMCSASCFGTKDYWPQRTTVQAMVLHSSWKHT